MKYRFYVPYYLDYVINNTNLFYWCLRRQRVSKNPEPPSESTPANIIYNKPVNLLICNLFSYIVGLGKILKKKYHDTRI